MSEEERLAELMSTMGELRVELGRYGERQKAIQERLDERDKSMHEEFERLHTLLFAELSGYVRGQLDSVNGNINAVYREISTRSTKASVALATLFLTCAFLGALVATLVAERFGFITRLPMP